MFGGKIGSYGYVYQHLSDVLLQRGSLVLSGLFSVKLEPTIRVPLSTRPPPHRALHSERTSMDGGNCRHTSLGQMLTTCCRAASKSCASSCWKPLLLASSSSLVPSDVSLASALWLDTVPELSMSSCEPPLDA